MILQDVKVEVADADSRLVVKRMITSEGEFLNRKMAVTNGIFSCERFRQAYGKHLFGSPFQSYHVRWDKKSSSWDFEYFDGAQAHAGKNKRFFLPYKQRNQKQSNNLTWAEAESDFMEMVNKGVSFVPYPIPRKGDIKEWLKRKRDALSVMSNPSTQKIVPIISTKHHTDSSLDIIQDIMVPGGVVGLNCYELSTPMEAVNLSKIRALNCSVPVGDSCPLVVCFDFPRVLIRNSYVAGSFAFNCFGGDVFSEKAYFVRSMSAPSIRDMLERKPEKFLFLDGWQRGFNNNPNQIDWYGFELTRQFMRSLSVDEGLHGYQAVKWRNHALQQAHLDEINDLLLSRRESLSRYIRHFSRWNSFWANKIAPTL